jgi:hypothetical protein
MRTYIFTQIKTGLTKGEPLCQPVGGFEKVEVYKTSVCSKEEADCLLQLLQTKFPKIKFNFDLTDCDRILRAQGRGINNKEIIGLMNHNHFFCEPLPD